MVEQEIELLKLFILICRCVVYFLKDLFGKYQSLYTKKQAAERANLCVIKKLDSKRLLMCIVHCSSLT